MMDDEIMKELREIGQVMLGGYAATSQINRIQCDSQCCDKIGSHTLTCLANEGILERHLCDDHFALFCRVYPMMEQSPPEIPPPSIEGT